MPNLTTIQSQALYDGATKKEKILVNGVFNTIRVHSKLDGFSYYSDNDRDALGLTETSTDAEIETAVVNFWQTQTYLGSDPIGTSVPF